MSALTIPEAAEYLRIDRNAVGRLVRSGQLRHKRIGNRIVFREEWLVAFLEADGKGETQPITARKRLELAARKAASGPKAAHHP